MIDFITERVNPNKASRLRHRVADKIRGAVQDAIDPTNYVAVICPFGDDWLVGVQSKKTLIIETYVTDYAIGLDLRV